MSNTSRIAKNTLMLYFRQILIMLVSLYTVRVVLETLGTEDYGIYNVVAGVVTMLGFLSGAMAGASQRYFAFEIGRGDFEQLKKLFSLTLLIYVLIGVIVLVLSETAGLWFVRHKLVIPLERKTAALWVYQTAITSFLFTMLAAPYRAVIIAHEDMKIYAYMSIAEAVLKLLMVFFLRLVQQDKLFLYGILLCSVTFAVTLIYGIICKIKYRTLKFIFYWNSGLFQEMVSYTGWTLFGTCAPVLKNQGVTIILNQFFGPIVLAARGISFQVNSAISNVFTNFTLAVQPQIIKSYSSKDYVRTESLMFHGAKATYFLMYLVTLPVVLVLPELLSLWLKEVPEYTAVFTRLLLVETLINSVTFPLSIVATATGRIKYFHLILNGILLLCLPISALILYWGFPPYSVFVISLVLMAAVVVLELFIVRKIFPYSVKKFIKLVLFPILLTTVLSFPIPFAVSLYLQAGLLRVLIVTALSFILSITAVYKFGLSRGELKSAKQYLSSLFSRVKNG
jgi:O-antigen/teichoic acid export membrane protein